MPGARPSLSASSREILRIPVVVHVVYRQESENISDQQIHSQIEVLNEDYRARNADLADAAEPFAGLVDDARIEFELASRDPRGARTDGILRVQTDQYRFVSNDLVKSAAHGGSDPWSPKKYLNIWVCNLTDRIGYAYYPGASPRIDGVVVRARAFGRQGTSVAPFNLGRTTTHEVGHYLNLRHIWGESQGFTRSDVSACYRNYMDYADDAAMCMFTRGQVHKMRETLTGPRATLRA